MPFFDYECKHCESTHENLLVKRYDTPTHCPECGNEMKRLMSAPAGHMFAQHGGTDRGRVMSFRKDKTKRGV